jgi:hypothetical protein
VVIKLRLTPTCYTSKLYRKNILIDNVNSSGVILYADRRIIIEPGCSAAIPHGIEITNNPGRLWIMPTRDTLLNTGFLIENHPARVGVPLFTTVFNMTPEVKRVLQDECISQLCCFSTEKIKWELEK